MCEHWKIIFYFLKKSGQQSNGWELQSIPLFFFFFFLKSQTIEIYYKNKWDLFTYKINYLPLLIKFHHTFTSRNLEVACVAWDPRNGDSIGATIQWYLLNNTIVYVPRRSSPSLLKLSKTDPPPCVDLQLL
jgi:hypothetical protein